MTFLKHDLIYLRSFNEDDIDQWASWFNNPDTTRFMNKGYFPVTHQEQLGRLENMSQDKSNLQLAVVENNTNKLLGIVGLHKVSWIHRHADISILIGVKGCNGKGYGKAAVSLMVDHAFNKLNMNKLTAGMWCNNLASESCFKSQGFKLEGRKKEQFYYHGEYVDELNYGLLRSEWKAAMNLSSEGEK